MDPNETLRLILASKSSAEAQEHCDNLREWLERGGFAPKTPPKGASRELSFGVWFGTGTDYSITIEGNGEDFGVFHWWNKDGSARAEWNFEPRE